jgi:pSer/pThr/pTyr-binding forkhead associated (FHA) protein
MNVLPTLAVDSKTYHEIRLTELPVTIGRSADVNVSVNDRWVSRCHCEIDRVEDAIVVRDLCSSHGTYVNGERVEQVELKSGDRLGVGLTSFVATLDDHAVTLVLYPVG